MAVAAQSCTPVRSRWVRMFILMCDGTLSVLFKKGVCCNYPGTTAAWYRDALAAASPGHFVWQRLYKKMPYHIIRLPCPAARCGGQSSPCCAGVTTPGTLHATVTDHGGCGCLAGTFALAWSAGLGLWAYSGTACGGLNSMMRLWCDTTFNVWRLGFSVGPSSTWADIHNDNPNGAADMGSTCSPFDQKFQAVPFQFGTPCTGSVTAEVTA